MNNLLLGFLFVAAGIAASLFGKADTSILCIVVSCYFFLKEDITKLAQKIK